MAGLTNARKARTAVIVKLTNNEAVAALCGGRVVSKHSRASDLDVSAFPRVVVQRLTGGARYSSPVQTLVFDVYAYSMTSQDEADELYQRVHDALQAERVGDPDALGVAGYARETEAPVDGYNDSVRAWFARGKWQVTLAG